MRRLVVASGLAVGVLAIASCRDATEVDVDVHTNVPWSQAIVTSFTVGSPGQTEGAFPTTETSAPWGADGFVGSLVVVPGSSKNAALSVKVVMGVHSDTHECTIRKPDGCIFARRTLSYIPHRRLELPIVLYAACEGVPCDASTTCNELGLCVPSAIDPGTCYDPSGCAPPGDRPPEGGLPPDDGAAPDDGPASDAPTDTQPDDSGGGDASTDASIDAGGGPVCIAGLLECMPTACMGGGICCGPPNDPASATCVIQCKGGNVRYCCSKSPCLTGTSCIGAASDGPAGTCQ